MSKKKKPNNKKKTLPFPDINTKTVAPKSKESILKIVTPIAYRCEPTPEYMSSINALIEAEDDLPFKISYDGMIPCTNIGIGRNVGINGGQSIHTFQKEIIEKMPYNGILFIDSDMEFTVDDVMALINRNVPIICGKYENRMNNDLANAGYWSQKIGYSPKSNWLKMKTKGFQKVDWGGSGFLYCAKYILENMTYPWFFDMALDAMAPESGQAISIHTTDEFGFATKAFRLGANIFCDCDVELIHHHGMIPKPKEEKDE